MSKNLRHIALLVVLATTAACSDSDSVEQHLASANTHIAKAELPAAVIELKNAIRKDARSAEARYLLARVYIQQGDLLAAEKELGRALELGAAPGQVLPDLAQVLLEQGKRDEVLELDATHLQEPARSTLLARQATAALQGGDLVQAEKVLEDARNSAPDSAEVQLVEARLLAVKGQVNDALAVLAALTERDPGIGLAWELQGDLYASRGEIESATVSYRKAIELLPNNLNSRFKLALLQIQTGEFEAAQVETDALLAVAPQNPFANYLQGLIHFQNQAYENAITALTLAEPIARDFSIAFFFLAASHLVEGNLAQAGANAQLFHELVPDSIRGRKLLATVRMQQDEFKHIAELIQPVVDEYPDDVEALNLLANALIRTGRVNEGVEMLQAVARLQPDSPVAQLRLGAGMMLGGQGDSAAQQLEVALELDPEFQQAEIMLVLNHLQKGDNEAAVAAAKDFRRRNLTDPAAHNLLGRVYQDTGDTGQARKSYEDALKLSPADPSANHNMAQLEIADGDFDTARQRYLAVLAEREKFLPAQLELAKLALLQEDRTGFESQMTTLVDQHPTALEPRLMLARYYLASGRADKVNALFTDLPEQTQRAPQVLELLARAQMSQRQHADAEVTLNQLSEAVPESAELHYMKAQTAGGGGNVDEAKRELQRALELDRNHLPSLIAMARLAYAENRMDDFSGYLDRLVKLAPGQVDVLHLRSVAARRAGDSKAALGYARQAFEAQPTTVTVLNLSNEVEANEGRQAAIALLGDWLMQHPNDLAVIMAMATRQELEGNNGDAIAGYQQALKINPVNPVALNNLAWHMKDNQPAQALEYARKAHDLAPESADILDTLAMVEYAAGDYRQARRHVERAAKLKPGQPSVQYHQALIYAALEDNEGAVKVLEGLLQGEQDFPERGEAEELLGRLRGG